MSKEKKEKMEAKPVEAADEFEAEKERLEFVIERARAGIRLLLEAGKETPSGGRNHLDSALRGPEALHQYLGAILRAKIGNVPIVSLAFVKDLQEEHEKSEG